MQYFVVGLGNPDLEYKESRHNAGRLSAEIFAKKNKCEFKTNAKANAQIAKCDLGKNGVVIILPDTSMNKSGEAVKYFIKNVKSAERLIVLHDDLDLPIGAIKIMFARGSGGHKGVESIIKHIKTNAFIRIKIGISKRTAKGIAKKPTGEKAVVDFVLGSPKGSEKTEFYKSISTSADAVHSIVKYGLQKSFGEYNQKK